MKQILLGVNIDHVATLRNVRGTQYPDPVQAAFIAEDSGVDGVTIHLREDRRHITDRDVKILRKTLQVKMNLEMSIDNKIIDFACYVKPEFCCLVPERREEYTTESGLDVVKHQELLSVVVKKLTDFGITVSLFIDPDIKQIDAASEIAVKFIEIHTGYYANADTGLKRNKEFDRIKYAVSYADNKKLKVNAGHGLNYYNVKEIAKLPEINELNIGHAIISRSLFIGMKPAIKEMKKILYEARK